MRMKIVSRLGLALLLGLSLVPAVRLNAERQNMQVTVSAGTPVRLANVKTLVARLMIQSRHANTGLLYLMAGVPTTTTCNASSAAQLTAELGPGDSTHPGSSYSDPQGANGNTPADAEDLSQFCIDGTVTSDVAIVTYWRIN